MKDKIVEILKQNISSKIVFEDKPYGEYYSEIDGIDQAAEEIVAKLGLGLIPVTERMPEELVPVLVYSPKQTTRKTKFDVSWRYEGRWVSWWLSGITHWCPLPAEPVDYSMFENPLCDLHDFPMKKVNGEHVCEICEWEEKESLAKRW